MNNKTVFITGSASGVGLHLTERFLKLGYRVVATDINVQALKAEAKSRAWPTESVWVRKLDVTQRGQWRKLFEEVLEQWHEVDVMCNVAGYLKPGLIHETDETEIDRHLDINVKGLILGSKITAEQMVSQKSGHIINIASLAGIAPVPGIALYSASKFAVRGFSLALAQELKPLGVSVSVVCPDAIETPMLTLQEDYEEAALTFSGNKTLSVQDIGDLVTGEVLKNKPLEVMIPGYRGWLAKFGNTVPGVTHLLSDYLGKVGKEKLKKRKLAKQ